MSAVAILPKPVAGFLLRELEVLRQTRALSRFIPGMQSLQNILIELGDRVRLSVGRLPRIFQTAI
jgi:hypothetical protein